MWNEFNIKESVDVNSELISIFLGREKNYPEWYKNLHIFEHCYPLLCLFKEDLKVFRKALKERYSHEHLARFHLLFKEIDPKEYDYLYSRKHEYGLQLYYRSEVFQIVEYSQNKDYLTFPEIIYMIQIKDDWGIEPVYTEIITEGVKYNLKKKRDRNYLMDLTITKYRENGNIK